MKHPFQRQMNAALEFRALMKEYKSNVACPKYRKELAKLKAKHGIETRAELKAVRASLKYQDALKVMKEQDSKLDFYSAMDALQSFAIPASSRMQ